MTRIDLSPIRNAWALLRFKLRYAADQLRLLVAEELIFAARDIAPKNHPDSRVIQCCALAVAKRKPTT